MYKKVLAKLVRPVRPAMPKPAKPPMGGSLGVISPPQSNTRPLMKKITPEQIAREKIAQKKYAIKKKM